MSCCWHCVFFYSFVAFSHKKSYRLICSLLIGYVEYHCIWPPWTPQKRRMFRSLISFIGKFQRVWKKVMMYIDSLSSSCYWKPDVTSSLIKNICVVQIIHISIEGRIDWRSLTIALFSCLRRDGFLDLFSMW